MASEIRVNKINSRTGVGTITLSPTGVDFTGIATVATLKATTGIVTTLSATGNATVGGTLSVTGDVDIADKIVHTGDTNTAIRFPAADTVTVETGGSERLRIKSDGNIGIGTTNPTELLHLIGGSSSNAGTQVDIMRLVASDFSPTNSGGLTIGAVWHNTDVSRRIAYLQSSQNIDSGNTNRSLALNPNGGNIGIGTDDPSSLLHLNADGTALRVTRGSSIGFLYNTGTNSTDATRLQGNSGPVELYTNAAQPIKVVVNGTEEARFLSGGGLTFNGDTAQANALDDYEEGTFTATCANSVTLDSTADLLQYVKIGASVTVMGQIRVNSSNSGSSLTINNLPFTVFSSGEASSYAVGAVRLYSADMASDHKYVICVADGGSTNLTFQGVRDNNTSQGLGATDNGYYMFSVTYRTTT